MKNLSKKTEKNATFIAFILPASILYLAFFIVPFARSIFYSFTNAYGYNTHIRFIGIENYLEAFTDKNLLTCFWVTIKYTIFVSVLGNLLSLLLAIILDSKITGKGILRTIFFLPNVMSLIIVGFIWTFMYGDVFRSIINLFGNPEMLQISWLGNTSIAIFSIGLTAIWQSAGYSMIIYVAGLQNVPLDVIEAASIDGAKAKNIFWNIKLPLIVPVIIMNLVLSVTSCLKAFDFPVAMTGGGPGYATTTLALYIYTTGFKTQRTGYATAISVLLFLVIALFTAGLMKYLKSREEKL